MSTAPLFSCLNTLTWRTEPIHQHLSIYHMNLKRLSLVLPLALHSHTVLGTHSVFLLFKVSTYWLARPLCSTIPRPATRDLQREHFGEQPRATQVMPTYKKQPIS